GIALPTVFFLAVLWPQSRWRERTLLLCLAGLTAGAPWITGHLDRFETVLEADRAPFYGVSNLESRPATESESQRLRDLAVTRPENSFVQFGNAWVARQSGDL